MSTATELPNLGEVLAGVLQRVPAEHHALLIALAERLAAERYRSWAEEVAAADRKAGLLACAAREEQIATRVEALHPDAESVQDELRRTDLLEINRSLFAGLTLAQQFALQAGGERLGAMTWRSFARRAEDPTARQTYLDCAVLEEESAAFLESLA